MDEVEKNKIVARKDIQVQYVTLLTRSFIRPRPPSRLLCDDRINSAQQFCRTLVVIDQCFAGLGEESLGSVPNTLPSQVE